MFNKIIFFLTLALLGGTVAAFAQTTEEITITTYYPSPYGSYGELRSRRMAVGTNWFDAGNFPWDTDGVCSANEICNADFVAEGNVGIGDRSPDAVLDIASTAATNLFRVDDNGDGDTTPFVINQDGYVGIGTTAPGARLQIDHATEWPLIINKTGFDQQFRIDNAIGQVRFYVGAATDNAEDMVINNTGNVGIGDSSPDAVLDIASTAATDLFRVDDNGDGDTTPFVIDQTGEVGIGTTAPTVPLHINRTAGGAIRIVDTTQGVGKVLTSDANGVGTWQSAISLTYYLTYYCNNPNFGSPKCVNSGGLQGFCPGGYTQVAYLGSWGFCYGDLSKSGYPLFPGNTCSPGPYFPNTYLIGDAYVCTK